MDTKDEVTVRMLEPSEYRSNTSRWITAINQNSGTDTLTSYFYLNGRLITDVLFSLETIQHLISSQGTYNIKTRFCLVEDERTKEVKFNIVIFGTDKNDVITTAYFLGTPYADTGAPPDVLLAAATDSALNIPDKLAVKWISTWMHLREEVGLNITSDTFFKTIYGYLEGYTFIMLDFLDAIYDSQPTVDRLRVRFSLHTLCKPGMTLPTNTFGLVLQAAVWDPGAGDFVYNKAAVAENLYYDISAPSPPY